MEKLTIEVNESLIRVSDGSFVVFYDRVTGQVTPLGEYPKGQVLEWFAEICAGTQHVIEMTNERTGLSLA